MEATKLVDEECFEITVDTHGIRDGPRLGRLRVQNKVGSAWSFTILVKLENSNCLLKVSFLLLVSHSLHIFANEVSKAV